MKNKDIEVEGGELIISNENGDYAILPKKYRREVQDMIAEGCHNCIDHMVAGLPLMKDYAEDGTLISGEENNKNNE